MPKSIILAFDSGHISLADDLVASRNKFWIDGPPVSDIKEAVPGCHNRPQGFKRFSTIADDPPQDPSFKMVYSGPNPDFVFLSGQTVPIRPIRPPRGGYLARKHREGVLRLA